jgi:tol-pal system protein YbgF
MSTLRLLLVPAVAAGMVATACAASAQGGFLDELFGNSERFSAPASRPPAQAQQPPTVQPGRGVQDPGDMATRIERLQAQIRQLTGAIEELQHRNQLLEAQLRRAQGGEPPERSAAGPQPPAAAPTTPAPGRRSEEVFDPAQHPNAPGAPHVLGTLPSEGAPQGAPAGTPNVAQGAADDDVGAPGGRAAGAPLDLSTLAGPPSQQPSQPGATQQLPPPPPRNPSSTGAQVATLPPSISPRDTYDLAYGYIMRKDYALAEEAFQNFLQRFPSDRLAPDAQYWLGETLFQRQRYRDAAEAFLNVSTKHENNARAPDALLRLGQSLAALGEREAACASLGEVLRKYPRASVAIRQGVDREQKRVRC